MVISKLVIARALYLLSFLPLTSSLQAETSLEPRQGGFDTSIWIFTFYGCQTPTAQTSIALMVSTISRLRVRVPLPTQAAYILVVHEAICWWQWYLCKPSHSCSTSGQYGMPTQSSPFLFWTFTSWLWDLCSPYLEKFLIYKDDSPSCGGSPPHFDV